MKDITAESLRIEREHLEQSQSKLLESTKKMLHNLSRIVQKEEKQSSELHVTMDADESLLNAVRTKEQTTSDMQSLLLFEFHVTKEQMDAYLETINTSQLVLMSIALEQITKEHPDTLSEDFQLASDLYASFEKRACMYHAQQKE